MEIRLTILNAVPTPAELQPPKLLPFLAKHNGAIPDLAVEAFETYIAQTRNEWENNRTYWIPTWGYTSRKAFRILPFLTSLPLNDYPFLHSNAVGTVEKTVEETTREHIINLIRTNPKVTIQEMTKASGLTRRGVEYQIS